MNTNLNDLIVYVCQKYPRKDDLSKSRLTKIIYLIDWKYALEYGTQFTDIKWFFNNYGPYVEDVYKAAVSDTRIYIKISKNYFDNEKTTIHVKENISIELNNKKILDVINFVINITENLNWGEFIKLVYSTFPIVKQEKFTELDLRSLAKLYKSAR